VGYWFSGALVQVMATAKGQGEKALMLYFLRNTADIFSKSNLF